MTYASKGKALGKEFGKKSGKGKGFNLNDLENMDTKSQNMLFGILGKHKGLVLTILLLVLLNIISMILTFLMAFGLL